MTDNDPDILPSNSVGDVLKAERRRQGKSIPDVQAATHIMGKHIQALEEGRYSELPSPAYIKGFIQQYAKYLDVPAEPLLERFRSETPTEQRARFSAREPVMPTKELAHGITPKAWMIVAVAAAVALTAFGAAQMFMKREKPAPLPVEATGTAASEETADPGATTTEAASQDGASEESAPKPFELSISVKAGGMSWVRVVVDGLEAYEGTMPGGESKSWEVTDEAQVKIGKPSSVTVKRDGKTVKAKASDGIGVVTLNAAEKP